MKQHTTNYKNHFIAVAQDSKATEGTMPPEKKSGKTVALMQFEKLHEHPYKYTSDELIYEVYAERNEIPHNERAEARELFFSKGQPCMRTSALAKTYGWGIHSDAEGRLAIYGMETPEYRKMSADKNLTKSFAMSSSRK